MKFSYARTYLFILFFIAQLATWTSPLEAKASKPKNAVEDESLSCYFLPPKGWEYIDPKVLPPLVKVMIRGKGVGELPPSINLAVEKTDSTIEEYLNAIKTMNQLDRCTRWSRLGTMPSQAGELYLTQLDTQSKWGEVRMIQAITIQDGVVYVLTATALRTEFSKYCSDFFKAIQSFAINKNASEMIVDPQKQQLLKTGLKQLQESWKAIYLKTSPSNEPPSPRNIPQSIFESNEFKTKWVAFEQMVDKNFAEMGDSWKAYLYKQVKEELFKMECNSSTLKL